MNRVLIGIRGEPTPEGMERILKALKALEGVAQAQATGPAQVLVEYDPQSLTVMDLIRTIREEGFLAGML
ncbi:MULTISPECIES: heavy-metal-associated domain-containing protein [Thermus]|uniref:heavy-metal-associated domain-containing protein n=1 Tax=Thermus TaxID=270 RepID=UPI001F357593|nr:MULTISPECIES: heavy-metal-associated domain-containing protein [Thermus]